MSQCHACTAGFYCAAAGLRDATGLCSEGEFIVNRSDCSLIGQVEVSSYCLQIKSSRIATSACGLGVNLELGHKLYLWVNSVLLARRNFRSPINVRNAFTLLPLVTLHFIDLLYQLILMPYCLLIYPCEYIEMVTVSLAKR